MPPKRLIIDTDPGIDDALAILLACASSELELTAVTTVAGNVPLALTTENALKLLELGGRPEVPVYPGAEGPIRRKPVVAESHGVSGLDGADLPAPRARAQTKNAVDHLVETLGAAAPGSLTLAAIGPLTNLALALQRAPGIGAALAELVIMGGATPRIGGNMSPHAEFNVFVDPEAASVVFAAGLPITLVPLDLSHQMPAGPARIQRFGALGSPVGRAVAGMLGHFRKSDGFMHDPLTIAWLLRPELFSGRRAAVRIETGGVRDGETVFDWREDGNCLVLLDGKDEAFFDLMVERLGRL